MTITTLTLGSTAITATGAEINILDGVTATAAELNILDGVTSTTAELNILDGVTSTAAELNILDGVTSTTAELNILDGVTSTAAELNILDGVTATTAELNYVDGVTSAIQTQLDAKAPLASPTFTGRAVVDGLTSSASIVGTSNSNSLGGTTFTSAISTVGLSSSAAINSTSNSNSLGGTSFTSNVGIGVSSPSSALDIFAPANTTPLEINAATDTANYTTIRNAAGTDVGYFGLGPALVSGTAATDFALRAEAGNMIFAAGGASERGKFSSDGSFEVSSRRGIRFGNSSLQGRMGSSGGGYPTIGYNVLFTETSGTFGTWTADTSWRMDIGNNNRLQVHSRSYSNPVSSGAAYTAGPYVAINGTSWTGGSDERLKENVSTITGADAIAKVKAMRPVNYSWKHDSESVNQLGFIAQEMLSAVPEVVDVPENETDPITKETLMWGITYDRLIPVLTAALQEALGKIETLEAKVQAMENN